MDTEAARALMETPLGLAYAGAMNEVAFAKELHRSRALEAMGEWVHYWGVDRTMCLMVAHGKAVDADRNWGT